jgi:two-component system KDP operon response regulator KdpE
MILDDYQYPSDVDYQALTDNEYDIFFSNTIEQVFEELDLFRIDAVILTLREDHEHKISIVQQLRNKKNTTIPIMMLSTYNTEDIRVKALRAGVDAFVSLPISNSEFLAQVENLFERAKLPERVHEPVVIGELQIDFAQRHVTLEDKNVSLTRIEYELLVLLALNLGQTLTHNKLLTEVWGPEYRDEKQYLWVNMSRLRRKLEKTVSRKRYIFTQPGIGYILRDM